VGVTGSDPLTVYYGGVFLVVSVLAAYEFSKRYLRERGWSSSE